MCSFIENETLVQVFSCEFCKIRKITCFAEHHQTTASGYSSINSISIIVPWYWSSLISLVLVMKWQLATETVNYNPKHCVKSFQIRGLSWSVFSHIQENTDQRKFHRANLSALQVKQQVSEAVVRRHQSLKTS